MALQPLTLAVNRSVIILCYSLALITTILRLLHRWKRQRLWWDDFWVFLAICGDTWTAMLCTILPVNFAARYSVDIRVFRFVGIYLGAICTRWFSMVSLAVSIVRIVQEGWFRCIAKAVIWFTSSLYIALALWSILYCGTDLRHTITKCKMPALNGYLELINDILNVAWLIGAPAYALWKTRLSPRHRFLLFSIFGSAILVAIMGIPHAYFVFVNEIGWAGLSAHIQLALAIMVCNSLVLVTWLYRVTRGPIDDSESESSDKTETRAGHETRAAPQRDLMERLPTYPRTVFTLTDVRSSAERSYFPQLYSTFDNPQSQETTGEHGLATISLSDRKTYNSSELQKDFSAEEKGGFAFNRCSSV